MSYEKRISLWERFITYTGKAIGVCVLISLFAVALSGMIAAFDFLIKVITGA